MKYEVMHTKKWIGILLCVGITLLAVVWGILRWSEFRVTDLDISKVNVVEDTEGYDWNIDGLRYGNMDLDDVGTSRGMIHMRGWFAVRGHQAGKYELRVVLQNTETDRCYIVPTMPVKREDVSESLDDDGFYDNAGFEIKVPYSKKINADRYDYKIYILADVDDVTRLVPLNTTVHSWSSDEEE
ncbi:MAG: hypothetical protein ACOYBC_03340 [Bilifractor sp.]|jgi:hypothetical protein